MYGIELRPAPEPGRRDQWAFVNFRNLADSRRARDELVDRVSHWLVMLHQLRDQQQTGGEERYLLRNVPMHPVCHALLVRVS